MPQSDLNPGTVSPVTACCLAALGGRSFAVASIAGDLAIGPFPGPTTPASQLVPFYAAHHAQVLAGGMLLGLSGIVFGHSAWPSGRGPADASAARCARAGGDRHHDRRAHHAGRRWRLRGARRRRRPVRHRPRPCRPGTSWVRMGRSPTAPARSCSCSRRRWPGWPPGLSRAGWPGPHCCSPSCRSVPGPFGFLASMVFLAWTAAAGITLLVAASPVRNSPTPLPPRGRGSSFVIPSRSPSRPRPPPYVTTGVRGARRRPPATASGTDTSRSCPLGHARSGQRHRAQRVRRGPAAPAGRREDRPITSPPGRRAGHRQVAGSSRFSQAAACPSVSQTGSSAWRTAPAGTPGSADGTYRLSLEIVAAQ